RVDDPQVVRRRLRRAVLRVADLQEHAEPREARAGVRRRDVVAVLYVARVQLARDEDGVGEPADVHAEALSRGQNPLLAAARRRGYQQRGERHHDDQPPHAAAHHTVLPNRAALAGSYPAMVARSSGFFRRSSSKTWRSLLSDLFSFRFSQRRPPRLSLNASRRVAGSVHTVRATRVDPRPTGSSSYSANPRVRPSRHIRSSSRISRGRAASTTVSC